jgi:hypothetical protein
MENAYKKLYNTLITLRNILYLQTYPQFKVLLEIDKYHFIDFLGFISSIACDVNTNFTNILNNIQLQNEVVDSSILEDNRDIVETIKENENKQGNNITNMDIGSDSNANTIGNGMLTGPQTEEQKRNIKQVPPGEVDNQSGTNNDLKTTQIVPNEYGGKPRSIARRKRHNYKKSRKAHY